VAQQLDSLLLLGAVAHRAVSKSNQCKDVKERILDVLWCRRLLRGGLCHKVEHRDGADGVELMTSRDSAGTDGEYGWCEWKNWVVRYGQMVHSTKDVHCGRCE
jgi:hypothetical protein